MYINILKLDDLNYLAHLENLSNLTPVTRGYLPTASSIENYTQVRAKPMEPNNNKVVVTIFIQPNARSTQILTSHISKHINHINSKLILNMVYVTDKNAANIKKMGITRTPTLVYNNKQYSSVEKIMIMLTPPRNIAEGFGQLSNMNPDEQIQTYQDGVINTHDEQEADPDNLREEELRRKFVAFQKRRPEMSGDVDSNKFIKGGRKVVNKQGMKSDFRDDADFRAAAGVDDQQDTPTSSYFNDQDGDSILEQYRNEEADRNGRRPNKKPIRWNRSN